MRSALQPPLSPLPRGFPRGSGRAPVAVQHAALLLATAFDGVNDRAEVALPPQAWPAEFTLMGWLLPTSVVGNRMLVGTTPLYGGDGLHYYLSGANLRLTARQGDWVLAPLSIGRRYHLACIARTGAATVDTYLDGALIATTALAEAARPTALSQLVWGGPGLGFYQGRLADWVAFTRALTPGEVIAHAAAGRWSPQAAEGLIAYYPLDQIGPGAAQSPDLGPAQHHLSLVNLTPNPIAPFA